MLRYWLILGVKEDSYLEFQNWRCEWNFEYEFLNTKRWSLAREIFFTFCLRIFLFSLIRDLTSKIVLKFAVYQRFLLKYSTDLNET
jgi:hypothetical protein